MTDELRSALARLLAASDLELVDVQRSAGLVRVTVDRPGGVDVDVLADLHRQVASTLGHLDPARAQGTLEVTSPGVERPLRRPEHFTRAVGETIDIRIRPESGSAHQLRGVLAQADEDGFVVEGDGVPGSSLRIRYEEVERARTVLEWGPGPRPGARRPPRTKGGGLRESDTRPATSAAATIARAKAR